MKKNITYLLITLLCFTISIGAVRAASSTCYYKITKNFYLKLVVDKNSWKNPTATIIANPASKNSMSLTSTKKYRKKDFKNGSKYKCPSKMYYVKNSTGSNSSVISIYSKKSSGLKKMSKTSKPSFPNNSDQTKNLSFSETSNTYNVVSCGDVNDIPASIPRIIRTLYDALKLLIPVIIIVLGIYDFVKAYTSSTDNDMKANAKKFLKRLSSGVIIFFILFFVELIISFIPSSTDKETGVNSFVSCMKCFINSSSSCRESTITLEN